MKSKEMHRTIEVPGSNNYFISTNGELYRATKTKRLKKLTGTIKNNKFRQVFLKINGQRKTVQLHRLVAETFIPNPNGLKTVRHIDGDTFNNNVDNLEWVSQTRTKAEHKLKINIDKNKNLILCEDNQLEFENSHYDNSLEVIATNDWICRPDCDIQLISTKYNAMISDKLESEIDQLQSHVDQLPPGLVDIEIQAAEIEEYYQICTSRLYNLLYNKNKNKQKYTRTFMIKDKQE